MKSHSRGGVIKSHSRGGVIKRHSRGGVIKSHSRGERNEAWLAGDLGVIEEIARAGRAQLGPADVDEATLRCL